MKKLLALMLLVTVTSCTTVSEYDAETKTRSKVTRFMQIPIKRQSVSSRNAAYRPPPKKKKTRGSSTWYNPASWF